MTDERIKEEYPIGLKMVVPPELLDGFSMGNKIAFSGFYAGFRAAERLAKIEVLEEVCKVIDSLELPRRAINAVTRMLSDLKGEQ